MRWWPTAQLCMIAYGAAMGASAWAATRGWVTPRLVLRFWLVAALGLIAAITLRPVILPSRRFTNFVPLAHILDVTPGDSVLVNVVGNVVLFVPLGLAVALLISIGHRRWPPARTAALVGLAVSLLVEAVQLAVPAGRVADVDDLILNTVGAALGGLLAPTFLKARCLTAPRLPAASGCALRKG